MKKILIALASLAVMLGLVGGAQASTTAQTTNAPPALDSATRAADLAKLGKSKHLTAAQLKKLGLKKASKKDVARLKQLQKKSNAARLSATAGTNYWFTWHNARNSFSDRYWSGPYYSGSWSPYYVVYDNWKTCTYSGTGCISAGAYTYQYYLRWAPNNTWYYYNTGGYDTGSYGIGWGPYAG